MSRQAFNGLIIVFMFSSVLMAHDSNSQKLNEIKINLTHKSSDLGTILTAIEDQTKFKFSYSHDINLITPVKLKGKSKPLDILLKEIGYQAKVNFFRRNSLIAISNAYNTTEISDIIVITNKEISGTVTDEHGEGLPGVNVLVKDTNLGTVTDAVGNYKLAVPEDATTLVFTYVGYLTEEVEINDQSIISISMTADISTLAEIVVIGFQELKKENVAGSVSQISTEDLNISTVPTTSSALVGRVAGLNFRQADGRPGSTATIRIRNFSEPPLYIIDGVQKDEGQFNNLDLNDIETISFLKDGEAAVYGVKGANGVVIVTTKSGKGMEGVTFNGRFYTGVQEWTRFPEMASAPDFVRARVEHEINSFGSTSWDPVEYQKWQEGTERGYQSFDWRSFIKAAPQQYYHLDATGGTGRFNFYTGLSFLDQEGVVEDFEFKRVNLQFNSDAEIANNLTLSTRINGRVESKLNPGLPWFDDLTFPLWALYRNIPTERPYANDNPDFIADNGPRRFLNFGILNYDISGWHTNIWRVFQGNSSLIYKIPEKSFLRGLEAKVTYGYYYAQNHTNTHEYSFDAFTYDEATDTYLRTGGNDNDWRDRTNEFVEEKVIQGQLSYSNAFDKHEVAAVVATEAYDRREARSFFFTDPSSNFLDLVRTDEIRQFDDSDTEIATVGISGRVNYSFAGKYIAQFVGRYDGSYLFPESDRWGFFPTVSFAYHISNEDFFNDALGRVVTDLKLRVSHGKLGSDNLNELEGYNPFDYLAGYNFGVGTFVGEYRDRVQPFNTIRDRGAPVRTISWIVATNQNIGIDFGLFENKLTGTFDVFRRTRDGLPARRNDVVLPEEVGLDVPLENLESDRTSGFDASLNYDFSVSDINISLGGVFTYGRTKFLDQYNPRFGNSWDHYRNNSEDRWTGIRWGFEAIGQFQSQEEIDNYPVDIDGNGNRALLPGDIIYKDVNGDNVINNLDARPIGLSEDIPNITYGFNVRATWKGIDFTAALQGATGYSYRLNGEVARPLSGGGNIPVHLLDRWHRADPFNTDSEWIAGKYPAIRENGFGPNHWLSDFWLINAHYLRLRNLEIGYTLPASLINKVGIKKARFYINGLNLVTIDNVNITDPEVNAENGRQYPQHRVINAGLNFSF